MSTGEYLPRDTGRYSPPYVCIEAVLLPLLSCRRTRQDLKVPPRRPNLETARGSAGSGRAEACTTDKETISASRVFQGTTIADWEVLERLAGVDSVRAQYVGANAAVFRARCVSRRCVEAQLPEYALKVMFRPAAEECHPSF